LYLRGPLLKGRKGREGEGDKMKERGGERRREEER